jgi:predicted O-methyltransferase YrrM
MHSQDKWTEVDRYIGELFQLEDNVLNAALSRSRERELPAIQVSFALGALLNVLARAVGARRILEVGTLGGFSSIFLARALPDDGVLYSLELEPVHASVARENLAGAGLADRSHVLVGNAWDSLQKMIDDGFKPFDLVFLDADKPGYTAYAKAALELSHPGTLIIADNVVREGNVADAGSDDEMVQGVRAFNAFIAEHPRLTGTVLQTVGTKGYDGIALAVVNS